MTATLPPLTFTAARSHRRLAICMVAYGVSTNELARMLGVGPSYVSQLTAGTKKPSIAAALRINEIFEPHRIFE